MGIKGECMITLQGTVATKWQTTIPDTVPGVAYGGVENG